MSGSDVIALQNVSFAYDETPVVQDASFRVREGSFAAVIGPNGGGKSTLLYLLLGLLAPQDGRIDVLGRSPRQARPSIGYMPQHLQFDPRFPITVEEVVELGALGRARSWGPLPASQRAPIRRAMDRVGCAEWARLDFASLSGGQKQLVLIARAVVGEPRLLLLDEPTANLDPSVRDIFYRLLRELKESTTVLLVSHDVGFVAEWSDTVICVNQRVVTHPATEVDAETLASIFGASTMHVVEHDHHDHPGE